MKPADLCPGAYEETQGLYGKIPPENQKLLLQAVLAAKAIIVQSWKSLAQLNLAHWCSILSELAGIGKLVFPINNKPNVFFQVILTVFSEI